MSKTQVPVEVYSRVSGYFRPIMQWNRGKQSEFSERKTLKYSETDIDLKIIKK